MTIRSPADVAKTCGAHSASRSYASATAFPARFMINSRRPAGRPQVTRVGRAQRITVEHETQWLELRQRVGGV